MKNKDERIFDVGMRLGILKTTFLWWHAEGYWNTWVDDDVIEDWMFACLVSWAEYDKLTKAKK